MTVKEYIESGSQHKGCYTRLLWISTNEYYSFTYTYDNPILVKHVIACGLIDPETNLSEFTNKEPLGLTIDKL